MLLESGYKKNKLFSFTSNLRETEKKKIEFSKVRHIHVYIQGVMQSPGEELTCCLRFNDLLPPEISRLEP